MVSVMARRAAHTRTGPDGRPVHVRAHDVRTRPTAGTGVAESTRVALAAQATTTVDRMDAANRRLDQAVADRDQAWVDVEHEIEMFDIRSSEYEAASERLGPLRTRASETRRAYDDTILDHERDVRACRTEIIRLYTEHGLPPRLAPLLADDTIKGHTKHLDLEGTATIVRLGALKTNKRGPKAAPTQAANEARTTDDAFQQAQQQVAVSAGRKRAAFDEWKSANSDLAAAERSLPPRPAEHSKQVATRRCINTEAALDRAQRAVDLGLPGEPANLSDVTVDDIVRQADGTLNVHVWGVVDPDTQEHDWIPTRDVKVDFLGSRLEDVNGQTHRAGEHYAGRGNGSGRFEQHVLVDRDATGSQPWVDAVDSGATGGVRHLVYNTDSTG